MNSLNARLMALAGWFKPRLFGDEKYVPVPIKGGFVVQRQVRLGFLNCFSSDRIQWKEYLNKDGEFTRLAGEVISNLDNYMFKTAEDAQAFIDEYVAKQDQFSADCKTLEKAWRRS
ncbi:hypothetical protein [Ruegeria sp. HKCCD8929]|uniref:hypothetical protein n=1 Tax=Ruegeria sp. HKCCD8929 TaxID=2683006 RepID=UPI001488D3AF|nr:hypothetical protein [Ruegeria sp. HKCCD8929]